MATYVVGDVQGCFEPLMRLVEAIDFDSRRDELWFVGDLVNRGPRNVEVLRWVSGLGDGAKVVLGNHDLHLIARAAGVSAAKRRDTIDDVLAAHDGDDLVEWLRHRPVIYERGRNLMVHAGVLPSWSREKIRSSAEELCGALAGKKWKKAIAAVVSDRDDGLGAISAVLQRVRVIDDKERIIDFAGMPEDAPTGAVPWFAPEHHRGAETRVLFGHWAALGLIIREDIVGLDSGCVWGRRLTAFNLEETTVTSVPCRPDG